MSSYVPELSLSDNARSCFGKTIEQMWTNDGELFIDFSDGSKVLFSVHDFCGHQYIDSEGDDLSVYVGAVLLNAILCTGGSHDVGFYRSDAWCFLNVITSAGTQSLTCRSDGGYGIGSVDMVLFEDDADAFPDTSF